MVGLAVSQLLFFNQTSQPGATANIAVKGDFVAINREEFNRLFSDKYALACKLLDCEAFQSWHTPSKSEWRDVLTMTTMLKKRDWPLYEVNRDGEDALSPYFINTGLMLNAIHTLLDAFNGYSMASGPSPGQWGDIMRVVDETTERRIVVDRAVAQA